MAPQVNREKKGPFFLVTEIGIVIPNQDSAHLHRDTELARILALNFFNISPNHTQQISFLSLCISIAVKSNVKKFKIQEYLSGRKRNLMTGTFYYLR